MTAAYYLTLAAEAKRDTLRAQGVTEQIRLRGLTTEIPIGMGHHERA